MKINTKTRFITDGRVVVQLGWYWQDNSYNRRPPNHGSFYGCQHWPANHGGRLYLGKATIPMQWLIGNQPFLKGFIAIKRALVPKAALLYFEKPTPAATPAAGILEKLAT